MQDKDSKIWDLLSHIPQNKQHAITVKEKLLEGVEDGKGREVTLTIKRQGLQPEQPPKPVRAESPKRAHEFHKLDGFIDYLKQNKGEKDNNTIVFANVPNSCMVAVLNDRAADGFEVIAFCPVMHPLFAPCDAILNQPMPLDDFVQHVVCNRKSIVDPQGKDLVMLLSQVRSSTTVKLHKGVGKHAINGLVLETEVQGEVNQQPVDLPDELVLLMPLYVGTGPARFTVDMIINSVKGGTELEVYCSSADILEQKVKAFDDMANEIAAIEGIRVGLGRPDWVDWEYLPQNINTAY